MVEGKEVTDFIILIRGSDMSEMLDTLANDLDEDEEILDR